MFFIPAMITSLEGFSFRTEIVEEYRTLELKALSQKCLNIHSNSIFFASLVLISHINKLDIMMYKILFAITLLIGIFSCKHADQDKFTNTHWVVTAINDSTVSTSVGLYFESSSKMSFSQSANSCGGNYSLSGDQLSIELEFCTEMCCDDELSGKVDDILSPNTSLKYKLKENELLLEGSTGKLTLALKDN